MKKVKVQNIKFRVIDSIAQFIYEVRERHLVRLNDWLDYLASKHYSEDIEISKNLNED